MDFIKWFIFLMENLGHFRQSERELMKNECEKRH